MASPGDQRLDLRELGSWILGIGARSGGFLPGHPQSREEIEGFVFVDQVRAFGVQPHEMRAVFPAITADAVIDAKEIGVGAIYAFAQRDANLRYRRDDR